MDKPRDWEETLAYLQTRGLLSFGPAQTLASFFDECWKKLRSQYRNEYVYKSELANRILSGRHTPKNTSIEIELPVGRSIVDVAVFNGTSTAYEIKTEFDTCRRLQTQTSDYLKVFDRVFVVTHPSDAHRFAELVDVKVGVLALEKSGHISTVKEPLSNRENLSLPTIFRCLRRSEYVNMLEREHDRCIQLPNGLIAKGCLELFNALSSARAHDLFVDTMRSRKTDKNTIGFIRQLPLSLRALGYATPLSKTQRQTTISALQENISLTLSIN